MSDRFQPIVHASEVILVESRILRSLGPQFRIVHRFRAAGTDCLPGEEIAAIVLIFRGLEYLLPLPLALRMLFDYLARHRRLPQSAAQITAGIRADAFYSKHGTNVRTGVKQTRKFSHSAIKEYVKRLRRALKAALDEAGLRVHPCAVLASESTEGNEVRYRLNVLLITLSSLLVSSVARAQSNYPNVFGIVSPVGSHNILPIPVSFSSASTVAVYGYDQGRSGFALFGLNNQNTPVFVTGDVYTDLGHGPIENFSLQQFIGCAVTGYPGINAYGCFYSTTTPLPTGNYELLSFTSMATGSNAYTFCLQTLVSCRSVATSWVDFTQTNGPSAPLDQGPWPTLDHDNQRTNRSNLAGPSTPGMPTLLYDAGSPVGLGNNIIVTSDGKIVVSTCSTKVLAINPSGGILWTFPLLGTYNESAYGLTATSDGAVHIAVNDCPDIPGGQPMHFYSLNADGTLRWSVNQSGMYGSPSVA